MSKIEILVELPKLQIDERREIWLRLGEMDGFLDDELNEALILAVLHSSRHDRRWRKRANALFELSQVISHEKSECQPFTPHSPNSAQAISASPPR